MNHLSIIKNLCNNTYTKDELDVFLKMNIENLVSFFYKDYTKLSMSKWEIDDCITSAKNTIRELDFSKYYNSLFILTLLHYSERFKLLNTFQVLYEVASENNMSFGHRNAAAQIFLFEIEKRKDHIYKFDSILELLQKAYEEEEDNEINTLVTFANYYSNALANTGPVDITIIRTIIHKIRKNKRTYSLLKKSFVDEITSVDLNDIEKAEEIIQKRIATLLEVKNTISFSKDTHLIERETGYKELLSECNPNFDEIRNVSMELYNELSDGGKTSYRNKLLRGVKIIDEEPLLYSYLTLYGKKHKRKLEQAFKFLPQLEDEINIIDWACGQGLASMIFLDYFANSNFNINQIILTEPSELALKRAGLHIKHYLPKVSCKTINKDIDSLKKQDVEIKNNLSNVHFFSNILDVEFFSLSQLISLIENSFSGLNYFVCVSPYISDIKKNRIDLFVSHFKNNFSDSFNLIFQKDTRSMDPTMVIRLFQVDL